MKKFFLFALVATMFAACVTDGVNDPSVAIEDLAPETLTVSFESADSRIQLQEGKTVWTKGDLVSVFYLSDANQKWQYQGATGERTGELKRVNAGTATEKMQRVVVVYPYNENYYVNTDTYNVIASLPAEQTYLKDSYGLNGNILISQSEFNQFSLKNVCGWLKVQLKGEGQVVKKITLKGNNGEQVAGMIYINSETAEATLAAEMGSADDVENGTGGNLVFDDTILTEVTLDCGEGVTLLGATSTFYIGLPPQTFKKGLTLEIEGSDGSTTTQTTDKEVVIERNAILPMAVIEVVHSEPAIHNNNIWYTATAKVVPYKTNVFGANIVLNEWNSTTGKGVITFDGDVTSIGENAFYQCGNLTSVKIPNRVTSIGDSAFQSCSSLTSITIPDSVTSIGDYAFYWCYDLTSVTIGNGVTSIGEGAFLDCTSLTRVDISDLSAWCKIDFDYFGTPLWEGAKLYLNGELITELIIPADITEIKHDTFCNCTSLTSVIIPDSVTKIGYDAFNCCFNLKSITIPDSVTYIGAQAFQSCSSLTSVTIPDSVTEINTYAFKDCSSLTSITIGNGVTSIGYGAFSGCIGELIVNCNVPSVSSYIDGAFYGSDFTKVTIGNGVTSIGNYAFHTCGSLTSITIPDSVTSIGRYAFAYCRRLIGATIPNGVTSIEDGTFYECSKLTSVTIPDSVTSIGEKSFYQCGNLTSVTIGNSVTSIGREAFYKCSSLTRVDISDLSAWCKIDFSTSDSNPLNYGNNLYLNGELITELIIPTDITKIKKYAFYTCRSLTSITIPDSVTSIGEYAFRFCSSLKEVYCKPTTPPTLDGDVFSWTPSNMNIFAPTESIEAYKTAPNWSKYASSIFGYDF